MDCEKLLELKSESSDHGIPYQGCLYVTDLVDILVCEGNLDRKNTARVMKQQLNFMIESNYQELVNVAKQLAVDFFSVSVSSESGGTFDAVMQALENWERAREREHAEIITESSSQPSQCLVSHLTVIPHSFNGELLKCAWVYFVHG